MSRSQPGPGEARWAPVWASMSTVTYDGGIPLCNTIDRAQRILEIAYNLPQGRFLGLPRHAADE